MDTLLAIPGELDLPKGARSCASAADAATTAPARRLPAGTVAALDPRQAAVVHCVAGDVWVTQAGDLRDVVLAPGQCFAPAGRGKIVVQAMSDAVIAVR